MSLKSRSAPPRASAMIEALRGLGYTTSTALADIIDNSISAEAKSVWMDFAWNGEASHVSILDDGTGMTAAELDAAMRLGERNPLDHTGRWRPRPIRPWPEDRLVLAMPAADGGQHPRWPYELPALGPRRHRRQR